MDPACRMRVHASEDVGEVVDGVDAVLLARGDERVEHGEVVTGVLVAEEKVVASAERYAAERSLSDIVVWWDGGEAQEATMLADVLVK